MLGVRKHNEGDANTWTLDNAKTPTEVQQAKDDLNGTLDSRNHNKGDNSANISDMGTKPLKK